MTERDEGRCALIAFAVVAVIAIGSVATIVIGFNLMVRAIQSAPDPNAFRKDLEFTRSCMNGNTVWFNRRTGYYALEDVNDPHALGGSWRRIPHSVAPSEVCA